MRYLLDTNIVSDLVRNPQGRSASRLRSAGEHNVCTSVIVASELRYGALRKGSRRLTRQLDAILAVLEIVPFETPADTVYAKVRMELEKSPTPIGGNDLLIASQALALGLTLATNNEREFARVRGLKINNWLT